MKAREQALSAALDDMESWLATGAIRAYALTWLHLVFDYTQLDPTQKHMRRRVISSLTVHHLTNVGLSYVSTVGACVNWQQLLLPEHLITI